MDLSGTQNHRRPTSADTAWRRALSTLSRLVRPRITITEPPTGATVEWDVAVPVRDGTRLRVNVFRPTDGERHPVLLCAHPYGKDDIPLNHPTKHGYRASAQYHLMRSAPVTHSAWTSWEGPDPARWLAHGYAVVNADLRGWGTSEGEPHLLSAQEGLDVHDLIEWAANQPWSSGRVGMTGVSYLAVSQWLGAATRPPHLAAICPWEGFTDFYRDFARPGGIRETGFLSIWATVMRRASGGKIDLRGEVRRRPLIDDWYAARTPDLEHIDVPALICGSFSDHNLHTRGSFEGFRRIGSTQKWLYTHRGPKWQAYYSDEVVQLQTRFFDHFLKGEDTGITEQPSVRLEIREDRSTVAEVRDVTAWPPPGIRWRTLHCRAGGSPETGTLEDPGADDRPTTTDDEVVRLHGGRGRAGFSHRFATDTRVVGPMVLALTLSVDGADDFPLVAGIRKFRDGKEVTFEGSYGFQGDLVTHGMVLASHRALDTERSLPHLPVQANRVRQPLGPGEQVDLVLGLLPSATLFRAGEELRLDLQGRWFHGRDPVHGQFPVGYRTAARGICTLHLGSGAGAILEIPVLD